MESRFHMRLLPGVLIKMLPIAVALMAGIAMTAYWHVNTTFRTELHRGQEREGVLAIKEIDARLGALSSVLDTIARNGFIVGSASEAGASGDPVREERIKLFFESLTMVAVPGALVGQTDKMGRVIAANREIDVPAALPDFREMLKVGRYLEIEREQVTLAVPIMRAGKAHGVVFARFPSFALATYMNLSHFGSRAFVTVGGISIATDVAAASFLRERAADRSQEWIEVSAQSAVYPELGVLLFSQRGDLLAPLRGLDRTLGLSAMANLAVLTIALIMTAMLVARPLVRFAQDVNDVRDASDLSRRVSARGYLEVVKLAQTFNEMMGRLQKTLVSYDLLAQENRYRRAAEQTLRDKQAETSAIVETVADAIIVIDKHGTIRSANPASYRIFGYEHRELLGHNVAMLMATPHSINHDQYIRNYLETGEAKIIGIGRELEARRYDGGVFPIELFVADIILNDEPHFVGVIRDITERRRVDRMQREFIALVSHELRTPLTSLTASLGLVRSGRMGELPDKAQALVDLAQKNVNRLIDLVNDIMAVEKLQSGRIDLDLEVVDIVALVRSELDNIAGYGTRNGVRFALHTSLEEGRVVADPKRLGQVLANLLSNAAKFSGENAIVTVRVEREGRFFRVSVCDQGVGIPPDGLDKVFDKFVQLDTTDAKNGQGSGLGLSIAQAIMKLHGSRIEVESEVGRGSTFRFDLVEHQNEDDEDAGSPEPQAHGVMGALGESASGT